VKKKPHQRGRVRRMLMVLGAMTPNESNFSINCALAAKLFKLDAKFAQTRKVSLIKKQIIYSAVCSASGMETVCAEVRIL
jgi:hypothetical protein